MRAATQVMNMNNGQNAIIPPANNGGQNAIIPPANNGGRRQYSNANRMQNAQYGRAF